MLKRIYFVIVSLLLISVACSSNKTSKDQAKKDYNESTLRIRYNSSACYGKCPVFEFIVFGNGQVVLDSKSDFKLIGTYQGKISKDQVYKLVEQFDQSGYWDMADSYDNAQISDLPTYTFEYFKFPKTKEIKMRFNAPKQLSELRKVMLTLIDDIKWEKVEDKNNDDKHD